MTTKKEVILLAGFLLLILAIYVFGWGVPVTHDWKATYCQNGSCREMSGEIYRGDKVECPHKKDYGSFFFSESSYSGSSDIYTVVPDSCIISPR